MEIICRKQTSSGNEKARNIITEHFIVITDADGFQENDVGFLAAVAMLG